jgi:hypothetical protein
MGEKRGEIPLGVCVHFGAQDGLRTAKLVVPSRRSVGMASLDKVCDPHPKIERIAVTHNPPPVQESESQLQLVQKPKSPISRPML